MHFYFIYKSMSYYV